jgi:hypothetical protein
VPGAWDRHHDCDHGHIKFGARCTGFAIPNETSIAGIVLHGWPSISTLGTDLRTPSAMTVRDSGLAEKAGAATRPNYRIRQ